MANGVVSGLFHAERFKPYDRPVDMEPVLHLLETSSAPYLETITRKIGKKVPKNKMRYFWRKRNLLPYTTVVTANAAAGATQIQVENPSLIGRDCGLYNTRTHELMLNQTDAAVATNPVTIVSYTNDPPGSAGLKFPAQEGDILVILPEFHAEGEEVPEAFRSETQEAFDHIMQIDRRGADITDIADAEEEWDPVGKRNRDNQIALMEYMRGISLLMYLSQSTREVVTASGVRRHAMGGLREKLVTNRFSLAGQPGAFSPTFIGEVLRRTKYYSGASQRKIVLAGQNAITRVSSWPMNYLRVSPREKAWGISIQTIITPHGEVDIGYDPLLTADAGLADVAVFIDPAVVRQTYLRNMGMKVIKKVSNLSSTHRIVDVVTGTFGIQVTIEEWCAWVEGIE